jgi:hypothetical protein
MRLKLILAYARLALIVCFNEENAIEQNALRVIPKLATCCELGDYSCEVASLGITLITFIADASQIFHRDQDQPLFFLSFQNF